MVMHAEKIDPNTLKKGDLFRGKYYEYEKNHIFYEIVDADVTLKTGKKYVSSICNKWFHCDSIHEPSKDAEENLSFFCKRRREKQ